MRYEELVHMINQYLKGVSSWNDIIDELGWQANYTHPQETQELMWKLAALDCDYYTGDIGRSELHEKVEELMQEEKKRSEQQSGQLQLSFDH